MIDNDQLTALAREYAEIECPEFKYKGDKEWRDDDVKSETFSNAAFLTWLLRRFCLVEKSKATELCRLTLKHGDSVDYGLIDGLTDIMCDIFPEQYQQVAEELSNPEIAKEVEG